MWTPMMAAGEPPGGGRVFASRIKPDRARRFVTAGLGFFAVAIGLGVYLSGVVPVVPVVFAAALVFHFWPAITATRPAITLEDRGLAIDGFGRLFWDSINRARIHHINRGPLRAHVLELELVLPASTVVSDARAVPFWRKWQTKFARITGQNRVLVDLTQLEDPPGAVLEALEYFLKRRVRGNVHG